MVYLQTERRLSPHTITAYRGDLNAFAAFLSENYPEMRLTDSKHQHIRSWMVDLVKEGQTARSVNRKVSALRSFYKFLQRGGHISTSPCTAIQALKIPKRLPVFVREAEMSTLNKLPKDPGFRGVRDRLLVDLLYMSGMRRAELIALEDSDLDKSRGLLRVLGKGGKMRLIPIAEELAAQIEAYQDLRNEKFPNTEISSLMVTDAGKKLYPKMVYNVVKRYLSAVTSQKNKGPHVLRHSFATHLSDHGADINALKNLLGHASLAATQIYTHNSAEKLKQVYKLAHPKSGN